MDVLWARRGTESHTEGGAASCTRRKVSAVELVARSVAVACTSPLKTLVALKV